MRAIKILGAALLVCVGCIGVSANAQTSVSCNWGVVSSYGPPDNSWRDIVRECREPNGTLVATQSFRGFATGGTSNCSLSLATNISYTGACMSPSFTRNVTPASSAQSSSVASSVSACSTPGMRIQGGCANSYDSSMLTNPTYVSRCGAGCTLEYRSLGWTSACPSSGNGRSPEYGLFCK